MEPFRKDIAIVLDAAEMINCKLRPRKAYNYTKTEYSITNNTTDVKTYIIPDEEMAGYANGLLNSLSSAAAKLAMQIGNELKMNNALWYFDPKKNRSAINAIRELKEKKVLFSLVNKIYYVNPLCIRKGSAVAVANKTKEVVIEERGVCLEAIRPLKGKLELAIEPFGYDSKKLDLDVNFEKDTIK